MTELIKPKEIEITDIDGNTHKYIISRFPAMEGYELIANFPKTVFNKGESFSQHKDVVVKIFKYVEKVSENGNIRLTTQALINNHVPDWECIVKILKEIGEYNSSFLKVGKAQGFIDQLARRVPSLVQKILMDSLKQLSKKG